MHKYLKQLKEGILDQNPTFIQFLGMCPTLAVTTSASNAIGMGLAATAVLICSNVLISLLRKFIPKEVRIASYIVIISGFVTAVEQLLHAYAEPLYDSLGLYIPLIVVNCIILARAEAFASKNPVLPSAVDGLAMGLGFTLSLTVIGSVRELLGSGTWFGLHVLGESYQPAIIFILPAGAFLTLGMLAALVNGVKQYAAEHPRKVSAVQEEVSVIPDSEVTESPAKEVSTDDKAPKPEKKASADDKTPQPEKKASADDKTPQPEKKASADDKAPKPEKKASADASPAAKPEPAAEPPQKAAPQKASPDTPAAENAVGPAKEVPAAEAPASAPVTAPEAAPDAPKAVPKEQDNAPAPADTQKTAPSEEQTAQDSSGTSAAPEAPKEEDNK